MPTRSHWLMFGAGAASMLTAWELYLERFWQMGVSAGVAVMFLAIVAQLRKDDRP